MFFLLFDRTNRLGIIENLRASTRTGGPEWDKLLSVPVSCAHRAFADANSLLNRSEVLHRLLPDDCLVFESQG